MKDEQKNEEGIQDYSTKEVKNGNQPQGEQKIQPMRKIVIEFNNNSINITEANVASNFELQAILESVLRKIAVK